MKTSSIYRFRDFEKLNESGIYIFLNETYKKFYVGKALYCIFDRVKSHLYGSHNDKINNFVNEPSTGLYIFPIDDSEFKSWREYDHELHFIEYSILMYFINQGYDAINSVKPFQTEIKERYENKKDMINVPELIKFEANLFEGGFRELLLGKRYLDKTLKNNKKLKERLEYQVRKNKSFEENIALLKEQLSNQAINIFKDYDTLKSKLEEFEIQNTHLEKKLNENNTLLIKLNEDNEKSLRELKKYHSAQIYEKNKIIEELKYKLNFEDEVPLLNEKIKKAFINTITKIKGRAESCYKYLKSRTHYRDYGDYGDADVHDLHKKYIIEFNQIIDYLDDIVNDKNIYFKLCNYTNERHIINTIIFCVNMWVRVCEIDVNVNNFMKHEGEDIVIELKQEYIKTFRIHIDMINSLIDKWHNDIIFYV